MLTARDAAESRIKGLEIGADDYLSKPFEPRELSLRIANILKRAQPAVTPPAESVRFGPFVYHLARGELRRGEEIIRLTDREREMLRMLAGDAGRNGVAHGARRQWRHGQRTRRRRAGQSAAPQDRAQSRQSDVRADRARHRLPAGDLPHDQPRLGVATIRTIRSALVRLAEAWRWYDAHPGVRRIHAALAQIPEGWRRMSRWLNSVMPKGLYARALLIIIAPMVILQSVVAFVFMERHWNSVTQRLSAGGVRHLRR